MKTVALIAVAALVAVSAGSCSKAKQPLVSETTASQPATEAPKEQPSNVQQLAATIPAGAYTLDKAHSTLTFKVSHLGFSNYTAQFSKFDAKLQLDPKKPNEATLEATIDPLSLHIPAPPEGFVKELTTGDKWLDAGKFPAITYKSNRVEMTGDDTAKIIGDLTMHGSTHPVELRTKFNGGYPGMAMDPHARVGFSATGSFKRSDFGLSYGVPQPGSKMGVSDDVDVTIETEWNGPELPADASAATPAPKPN